MEQVMSARLAALIDERAEIRRDLERAQAEFEDADKEAFDAPTAKAFLRRSFRRLKRDRLANELAAVDVRFEDEWAAEFSDGG